MSTIEKALAKQKLAKKELNDPVQEHLVDTPPTAPVETTNSSSNNDVLELDKSELEKRGFLIDNGTRKSIKMSFAK